MNSKYTVSVAASAAKAMKRMPSNVKERLIAVIDSLQREPRPSGCKKLRSNVETYRARVEDYRIVYEISDNQLTVYVFRIGHRKDIYR